MKRITWIFFSFLFVLSFSCTQKKQTISIDPDSPYEVLRCLNCSEENLNSDPGFTNVEIIPLETTMECLISGVKEVQMTDNFIFVLDYAEKIFVFDYSGKHRGSIDERGPGPKEYNKINSFYLDEESQTIHIVDYIKSSIIEFDYQGNYRSIKKFPTQSFKHSYKSAPIDNNKLLVYYSMDMEDNMACGLYDMDKKELIGKYYSFEPIFLNNYVYPFAENPMVTIGDEIHFITPLCDTIYSYSSEVFSPKYIVETPSPKATREQIPINTSTYSKDISKLGNEGYFTGFTSIYETDSKIMLDFMSDGIIMAYFLFDKNKKEGYQHIYVYEEYMKTIPFFPIINSYKDYLVGMTPADYLVGLNLKLEQTNEKNKEFMDVLNKISEYDNPVLYLYKFD